MESNKGKLLINNSIPIEKIFNKNIYNNLIDDLICLVCLNIPLEPVQCSKCDIVICNDCLEILNLSQKNCLSPECQNLNVNSKKLYSKTSKFVREVLEKFIITCNFCEKKEINYSKYKSHLKEECEIYKQLEDKREDFIKSVKLMREKEEFLRNEIEIKKLIKLKEEIPEEKQFLEEIRKSLIVNTLCTSEKKNLHNSIMEGNLPVFKKFILDMKYPIFEEISAKSYYWTSLHYAMHYGKWNILEFILEYLKNRNLFEKGFKLLSNDGRCPIMCLLKSNSLKSEQKKIILESLLKNYDIPLSADLKKEIHVRNYDDLLAKYNKI